MNGRCTCSSVVRDELAPGVCISTTRVVFFCGGAETTGAVDFGVWAAGEGALADVGGGWEFDGGDWRFGGAGGG